jgi:uncharacterized protein (TIGR03435 family)
MRIGNLAALVVLLATASIDVLARAGVQPAPGPTFDVVSIKPNTAGPVGSRTEPTRPDGGITMINVLVTTLLGRAYRLDVTGLPDWATKERFDVIATSDRKSTTPDERDAMLKAMLADRFKLLAHVEDREYDTYDLVLAREDGRLGPGLKRIDADCVAINAERTAASAAAVAAGLPPPGPRVGPTDPLPPCFLRTFSGLMEGQATLESVMMALRFTTGPRLIVDRTGLAGSYEIRMEFDPRPIPSGPEITPPAPDSKPTVFTALQDQLGLKLVPSRTTRPTLVVDRLERPTEN